MQSGPQADRRSSARISAVLVTLQTSGSVQLSPEFPVNFPGSGVESGSQRWGLFSVR